MLSENWNNLAPPYSGTSTKYLRGSLSVRERRGIGILELCEIWAYRQQVHSEFNRPGVIDPSLGEH